jgi:hypothetical protein
MATENYERYLAGIPLSPELAALRSGQEAPSTGLPLAAGGAAVAPPEAGELSREERAQLREIRQMPGWAVLQKLLERGTIGRTKAAIRLSEEDPIGNGEQLSQLWATVKLWKTTIAELNWAVDAEARPVNEIEPSI